MSSCTARPSFRRPRATHTDKPSVCADGVGNQTGTWNNAELCTSEEEEVTGARPRFAIHIRYLLVPRVLGEQGSGWMSGWRKGDERVRVWCLAQRGGTSCVLRQYCIAREMETSDESTSSPSALGGRNICPEVRGGHADLALQLCSPARLPRSQRAELEWNWIG